MAARTVSARLPHPVFITDSTGNSVSDDSIDAIRVTSSSIDTTNNVMKVEQQFEYETVAASQTDQVLGSTGSAGDLLSSLVITVGTAASAATSIKDGAGSSIPILPNSPGGGIGVYVVPLNIVSTDAGWKVTTGAGSTVVAIGRFT